MRTRRFRYDGDPPLGPALGHEPTRRALAEYRRNSLLLLLLGVVMIASGQVPLGLAGYPEDGIVSDYAVVSGGLGLVLLAGGLMGALWSFRIRRTLRRHCSAPGGATSNGASTGRADRTRTARRRGLAPNSP
jgi:hypothetical protein